MGLARVGLQNLEPQGFRDQNLDNKELSADLAEVLALRLRGHDLLTQAVNARSDVTTTL
jgi:hypothetical protein